MLGVRAQAEKTRASALLRLAVALARANGEADAGAWVEDLKNGATVWIRLACPEYADAVAAMHERCSQQTLDRRYPQPLSQWRGLNLRRLSCGHRGAALVVMSEEGTIVAWATCSRTNPLATLARRRSP